MRTGHGSGVRAPGSQPPRPSVRKRLIPVPAGAAPTGAIVRLPVR
jgi:hypothetical protein